MTIEGEGQLPFSGLGMELVIDLDTRQPTLRPKTKKSPAGGVKKPVPTRQWWDVMGGRAFRSAKRSRITAVGVVNIMKAESLRIETRLGSGANWLPPFVDTAIDLVAEVYGLTQVRTRALKEFVHQRDLPAFS